VTSIIPADEAERMEAIRRYDILDTPRDGVFDRITRLAARFLNVPISTITIVDRDRIWFKSTVGLEAEQIDRVPGLCASAILQYEPWVVNDASVDPRTLENPLVRGELGLRFYVGIPLTTRGGYNLGTLNVIDSEPRDVTAEELATLQDLGAVVLDELELRLAARREEGRLELVRGDFLATASHELKTPLAAVYGAAKSLAARDHDEDVKGQLLDVIEIESARLAGVLERILLASELESDRISILREQVDPVSCARRAVEAVASSHQGRVELRVSDGVPLIESDSGRVRNVLANLVDNAVKYSNGGRVELAVEPFGGGVRYTVRDEGTGIPAGEQQRIFEKFYRLDAQQQSGISGTGLGLYVVRELVRRLGGKLRVESEPGRGAAFVVELPATL